MTGEVRKWTWQDKKQVMTLIRDGITGHTLNRDDRGGPTMNRDDGKGQILNRR